MLQRIKTVYAFGVFCLTAMSVSASNPAEKLPQSVNGWHGSAWVTYTQSNLYDYIDGGAELYISFGFKSLWSRRYQRPDGPEITVDVFDMGTAASAFGIFSHGRETTTHEIGQGAEYSSGLLMFWKANYYIAILAYPESDESRQTVIELGRRIDAAINETGDIPAIVRDLPGEGLEKNSVRYFRHYIWLNSHHFISHENILNIEDDCEAVLARYRGDSGSFLLLVAQYPLEKSARRARQRFSAAYLPQVNNGVARRRDGSWAGIRQQGRRLWIVLSAQQPEQINKLFLRLETMGISGEK